MLLIIMIVSSDWQPPSFRDAANSAEEFIINTTGLGGSVPEIAGFERVKTFRLDRYRAGLYRATPAPLLFARGRFVIYNRENQPVFSMETLEGSKEPWTTLYDFAGRAGIAAPGSRTKPVYTRSLTADGQPDIVVGQYSGGEHCCSTATVLTLGKDAVTTLARIEGLDGVPFDGFELQKIDKDADWEIVAHRPYGTLCGRHADSADVLAVYAYAGGQFSDQTARFNDYLESVMRQNLAKWSREKSRSIELLQTLATEYASSGHLEEGRQFFALNLPQFVPQLQRIGVDPNACLEDMGNLLARLASGAQPPSLAGN